MSVTVTRSFGDLRQILPSGPLLMQEVGDFGVRRIRTRTEQAVSFEGIAFMPLSESYGKAKQKALGHTRPDLTVSGRMLNDMGVVAVTETSAEISFRSQGGGSGKGTFIQRSRSVGAADKAFFHTQGNHGIIRDFFGLSDEDEALILAMIEADAERRIAQL
jgi:hypothetical protein